MRLLILLLLASVSASAQDILTTKGYIHASNVKVGTKVIGAGGVINEVTKIDQHTSETYSLQGELYEYYLVNGKHKFFKNQSIFANNMVVHVWELHKGDIIYAKNGRKVLVHSIKKVVADKIWYRFTISGDRSYVQDGILVHNATRFWVGGGSSTNWNATTNTNWSATSGGSNNATVPGSSDDVTFNGVGGSSNGASICSATITVLSLTFTSGYTNTVTLNAVPTIAGNFTDNTAHSWAGSSSMTISAASTITSGGKTFPNNVSFTNTNTKTLSGNWTISGILTVSGATTLNWTTNEVLSLGGLTANNSMSGTASITLTGGTWQSSGTISNNMSLAGNITVSGTVQYGTGTLTYTSGTVTTTSSTFLIAASTTFNTNGVTWNNLTISGSNTITINSLLSATGTLSIGSGIAVTFAGTAGFSVATLTFSSADARTMTLVNSVTYTVTTALNGFLSRNGSSLLITSDHATNKAILTLTNGATCNVLANFTRIDASAGRTIWTFNGTITSCNNINAFNDLKTVSSHFVN